MKVNARIDGKDVSVFLNIDLVVAKLLISIKNSSEESADSIFCRTGFPLVIVMHYKIK